MCDSLCGGQRTFHRVDIASKKRKSKELRLGSRIPGAGAGAGAGGGDTAFYRFLYVM